MHSFLPLGDSLPALWAELVCVLAPDFLAVVHGVCGYTEYGALGEVVAGNFDTGSGRDKTRQTLTGSAVDAESFLDTHVEVLEVLDLLVLWDVVGGKSFVEFGLEFLDGLRAHEHVEEESARGVGGGIGAGDELGKSLSSEFGTAELVAVLVLALHKTGEQVNTVDLASFSGFQTLVDTGDSDTSEVLDSFHTLGEERVREVFGVGLDPGNDTNGVGNLSSAVENLNGRSVGRGRIRACPDLSNIFSSLEHTEGSTESKIANDIEKPRS